MKKYQSSKKYKKVNTTRSNKQKRISRKGNYYDPHKYTVPIHLDSSIEYFKVAPVIAPLSIRLLKEPESTLKFFNDLRRPRNFSKADGLSYMHVDLKLVEDIDYSSICVLKAIIENLKSKKVFTRGILPNDPEVKQLILDSGLVNSMVDSNGKPFKEAKKSEMLFINTGTKRLSSDENIKISKTIKKVAGHLTGTECHCKSLRNIVLEICGNSLEWAQTPKKQWLIAVKYEPGRVVFTATDVGVGILSSLHRRFGLKLREKFNGKTDIEVLRGAFKEQYGSRSRQVNRNKGLPAIDKAQSDGLILELKVLTNKVLLDFDSISVTSILPSRSEFKGTFYRWIVTKESITKR